MKYLKYFEAKKKNPLELLTEYEDDIVRVLPLYYNNFKTDDIHHSMDDLIWNCQEADEVRGENDILEEDVIRELINSIKSETGYIRTREIEKILEIYYDCLPQVKSLQGNTIDRLKEIFYDYTDISSSHKIYKSAEKGDDRYIVLIYLEDIFLKMDFQEVIGRIKKFTGIENYNISGDFETFKIELWKPLNTDDDGFAPL